MPGFADALRGDDRGLLELRPGITGAATLVFRAEQVMLARSYDSEAINRDVVWPLKVRINGAYHRHATRADDLRLLALTVRSRPHRLHELLSSWDPAVAAEVDEAFDRLGEPRLSSVRPPH